MISTAMTAQRRLAVKSSALSWPSVHAMRQACDGFIELRQDVDGHRPALIAAAAVIGRHPVFVLIHGWHSKAEKRSKQDRHRSMPSRKSQHVLRLAQRFGRPIVVCVADPPGSEKAGAAIQRRAAASALHVMSQWKLDVPVILVISAAKVPLGIFGVWLADRCLSLAHSKFVLERPRRSEIEAKELVRCNILNGTFVAPASVTLSQAKTASYKLRHALIRLLDDVIGLSPAELTSLRKERLASIENLLMMRP
jgi:acetyl-CoA carboxylase alpha subunit